MAVRIVGEGRRIAIRHLRRHDADGGYLDGSKDDRLHFPRFVPNIPVKTFVVVPYDKDPVGPANRSQHDLCRLESEGV
jgi:hypothetical protein